MIDNVEIREKHRTTEVMLQNAKAALARNPRHTSLQLTVDSLEFRLREIEKELEAS